MRSRLQNSHMSCPCVWQPDSEHVVQTSAWPWCGRKMFILTSVLFVFPQTQNTLVKKFDCNCFPTGQPHFISLMFQYSQNARLSNHQIGRNEPKWPPVSACLTPLQCLTCGYINNTVNTQKTYDLNHLTDKLHCSNDTLNCTYIKNEYCLDVWNATSGAHTSVY